MVMLLGRVSVAVKAPTPEIAMKETRSVARRREILVDTLVLVLLVLNISGTQQEIEIKSDMATIIKNYDPSITSSCRASWKSEYEVPQTSLT